MRVRLTERALSLKQRASATPYSLSERASETGDECASGRASLRAATHTAAENIGQAGDPTRVGRQFMSSLRRQGEPFVHPAPPLITQAPAP